jgi:hypothetical protein
VTAHIDRAPDTVDHDAAAAPADLVGRGGCRAVVDPGPRPHWSVDSPPGANSSGALRPAGGGDVAGVGEQLAGDAQVGDGGVEGGAVEKVVNSPEVGDPRLEGGGRVATDGLPARPEATCGGDRVAQLVSAVVSARPDRTKPTR